MLRASVTVRQASDPEPGKLNKQRGLSDCFQTYKHVFKCTQTLYTFTCTNMCTHFYQTTIPQQHLCLKQLSGKEEALPQYEPLVWFLSGRHTADDSLWNLKLLRSLKEHMRMLNGTAIFNPRGMVGWGGRDSYWKIYLVKNSAHINATERFMLSAERWKTLVSVEESILT